MSIKKTIAEGMTAFENSMSIAEEATRREVLLEWLGSLFFLFVCFFMLVFVYPAIILWKCCRSLQWQIRKERRGDLLFPAEDDESDS